MNFFRKLFGLGPKEPVNTRSKSPAPTVNNTEVKKEVAPSTDLNGDSIYPILLSERLTQEFDLEGEYYSLFHDRENIFSRIVIGHFIIGEVDDKDGTAESYQIRTYNQDESYFEEISNLGKRNFESFDMPFVDWQIKDKKQNFKILSCRVSMFSSEKIMSKKHMLEAHKMLGAEEIMVSIPRRGLIFVCANNLNEEDNDQFLSLHATLVIQDNEELECLCEDIFILKDGEINAIIQLNEVSGMLRKKYGVDS